MKKIIFSILLALSMAGFVSAQTTRSKTSGSKTYTTSKTKKAIVKKTSHAKTVELDNRKEYMKDGQKATVTGHEATPTNGEQFRSRKDSANKKRKRQ